MTYPAGLGRSIYLRATPPDLVLLNEELVVRCEDVVGLLCAPEGRDRDVVLDALVRDVTPPLTEPAAFPGEVVVAALRDVDDSCNAPPDVFELVPAPDVLPALDIAPPNADPAIPPEGRTLDIAEEVKFDVLVALQLSAYRLATSSPVRVVRLDPPALPGFDRAEARPPGPTPASAPVKLVAVALD